QVLPGASLQVAAGGALTIEAMTTYADAALADGTAVNTATGIAAAGAVNRPTPTAEAGIARPGTPHPLPGTPAPRRPTRATAHSGQGSTDLGVAGALALNIPGAASRAAVVAGGSLTLAAPPNADLAVRATTTVFHDRADANGTAAGLAHLGVGGSIAIVAPL